MDSPLRTRTIPSSWRFALIGALASLPVTVIVNWLPASETNIAGGIMIFGAFISGFIAETRSTEPDVAGFRAGFIAGVMAVLIPLLAEVGTSIENTTMAWLSPSEMVFFVGASAVILCLAPIFGLVCGRVGGWAGSRVATRRTADVA